MLCATNRDLRAMIKDDEFREDLYFRVNTFEIRLPPLRERRPDIPALARHLLSRAARRPVEQVHDLLSPEAIDVLLEHEWPGNVRELANVIERAQILAEENTLTLDDLPENLVEAAPAPSGNKEDPRRLREVERRHVLEVLQQEKGNKVHAAKVLGISRRALYRLIAKYHLTDFHGKEDEV